MTGSQTDGSVVLFGGRAKDRPYPGSTTVSTVNGGVSGMVRSLTVQLAPRRVNAIHPGIVGDSPYWSGKAAGYRKDQGGDPDRTQCDDGGHRRCGRLPDA